MAVAEWTQLLPDLLTMIVKKLDLYEDFVSFGGVCRSWRSVAIKENFKLSPLQPPWLMLAEKETEDNLRGFVSFSKGGMVYKLELPEARGKRCIGSMDWLITLDKEGGMGLVHPLTRSTIPLPHLNAYGFFKDEIELHGMETMSYLTRATLSASPSATNGYAVMLILGTCRNLAFWKPGNAVWTLVDPTPFSCSYSDVICHKDKFYATNKFNNIIVCDVGGQNPTPPEIVGRFPPKILKSDGQLYLVECCGDLLLVKKVVVFENEDEVDAEYSTTKFVVYKATDSQKTRWEDGDDLGGASIFVGHSASFSVCSAASVGLMPNCIYFTDDERSAYILDGATGGKDMGIYNLASGIIQPLYGVPSLSRYCPPIWVAPSL